MKELLLGVDQLHNNDSLAQARLEEVHPRMHTGNLCHVILKPNTIGSSSVVGELLLYLTCTVPSPGVDQSQSQSQIQSQTYGGTRPGSPGRKVNRLTA